MVSNSEIGQEFAMFSEIWKLYKRLLPVGAWEDEAYWENVVGEIKGFMNQYPNPFSRSLAVAVLEELERRGKGENQNTGRTNVY